MKWAHIKSAYKWRRKWIRAIWRHYFLYRKRKGSWQRTTLDQCIRGTIAILFDWEDENMEWEEEASIAWTNFGTYWTEYGDGKCWDELQVKGFRYCIREDGSL